MFKLKVYNKKEEKDFIYKINLDLYICFIYFTNNFIISIKIILSIKNYKILFANMLLSGISIITGLYNNYKLFIII